MKIGFDVSQTGRVKAGCGYFADSLIRHLARLDADNQYILYPTFGDAYWDPAWSAETCSIVQANFQRAYGHRSLETAREFWRNPPRDHEKHLGNPDIIHSNNFYCPTSLKKARLIYTLYDLSFLVHPEWTTEENRIACFEGVFNASLYADFIISISEYSRKCFLETFPHYPNERIAVVYPSSRFSLSTDSPLPRRFSSLVPDQFWLNVGILEPRKNHKGLLRAYALIKKEYRKTFPLVLAGGKGWMMKDFEKELDDLDLRKDVICVGYVEDEELQWLYQHCFAFVYPSFFEGFGLPVLEAMSLGAAVISSNSSSIPEIAGQAGILIEPLQEKEIFLAMKNLWTNPEVRMDLKQKSIKQAAQFSWEMAAAKTLDCYRNTLSLSQYFLLPKNQATENSDLTR